MPIGGALGCGGDVDQCLTAQGPLVEVVPGIGVAIRERLVVCLGAGVGMRGEALADFLPVGLQRVQPFEAGAQFGELPGPTGLAVGLGNPAELRFGCGEEVVGAVADAVEGSPGLCVAATLAQVVGEGVQGPSVGVGVLVAVGVPVGEDLLGFAEVGGELVQMELVPGGRCGRHGRFSQRRGGRWRKGCLEGLRRDRAIPADAGLRRERRAVQVSGGGLPPPAAWLERVPARSALSRVRGGLCGLRRGWFEDAGCVLR